ncbi:MAG TPA: glutathione S-transferase C-terminal domain-containing protein, partial [Casimicrobiaceae bacterium]|nr:glutathione S-transferase C-terminal domain-containing protein [Casimicrobiaceae bacterium]
EKRRPAQEQSPGWIQRQEKVVRRCLDALEQQVQDFGRDVTIVSITTAVALGHFDFRVDTMDLAWRESNPNLRRWYETFAARGSMLNTLPHD